MKKYTFNQNMKNVLVLATWILGIALLLLMIYIFVANQQYRLEKELSGLYQNSSRSLCNYANSLTDLANLQETIIAQLANKTDEIKFLNKLNCTFFEEE